MTQKAFFTFGRTPNNGALSSADACQDTHPCSASGRIAVSVALTWRRCILCLQPTCCACRWVVLCTLLVSLAVAPCRHCAGAPVQLEAACGAAVQRGDQRGVPVRCQLRTWHLPQPPPRQARRARPRQVLGRTAADHEHEVAVDTHSAWCTLITEHGKCACAMQLCGEVVCLSTALVIVHVTSDVSVSVRHPYQVCATAGWAT